MILISIQSREVYNIIRRDKVYHAGVTKCREDTDYSRDIERLGYFPIWGFWQQFFNCHTMWDGSIIRRVLDDMSIETVDALKDKVLLELKIPDDEINIGISWNADTNVVVFPEIHEDYIRAVYTVTESSVTTLRVPHFKITPIEIRCKSPMISSELDTGFYCTHSYWFDGDPTPSFVYKGVEGKCVLCLRDTPFMVGNKHYCSLHCYTDMCNKIRQCCLKYNADITKVFFNIKEEDLYNTSVRKLVEKLK